MHISLEENSKRSSVEAEIQRIQNEIAEYKKALEELENLEDDFVKTKNLLDEAQDYLDSNHKIFIELLKVDLQNIDLMLDIFKNTLSISLTGSIALLVVPGLGNKVFVLYICLVFFAISLLAIISLIIKRIIKKEEMIKEHFPLIESNISNISTRATDIKNKMGSLKEVLERYKDM